jgi:hypothetical protein
MNYTRHREAAKKKLLEKQAALGTLNGAERTRAEKMLIQEAINEEEGKRSRIRSSYGKEKARKKAKG